MPYRTKVERYYLVDDKDIKPDMIMSEIIDPDVIATLSKAGYVTKLDIQQADDFEIAENTKGHRPPVSSVDLARLRKWCEWDKYEEGQMIALRYLVISQPGKNGERVTRDFAPGDLIPVGWAGDLMESTEAQKQIGIFPSARRRKKSE